MSARDLTQSEDDELAAALAESAGTLGPVCLEAIASRASSGELAFKQAFCIVAQQLHETHQAMAGDPKSGKWHTCQNEICNAVRGIALVAAGLSK